MQLTNNIYSELLNKYKLQPIRLKRNKTLFEEGNTVDSIYYIEDGEVFILSEKLILWSARSHEFVGVSSFLSSENTYRFTVKTCTDSIVYKIPIESFKEELVSNEAFSKILIQDFCKRIDAVTVRVKNRASKSSRNRLITLLVESSKLTKSNLITYRLNEISSLIGVSSRRTKLILKELEEKKLIRYLNGVVEILDRRGLEIVGVNKF